MIIGKQPFAWRQAVNSDQVVDKDKLSVIFTVSAAVPVSLTFISTDKKVQIITFSDSTVAALALVVPARD